MRRRQAFLAREEVRRTLNTEQAVTEPPAPAEEPAPEKRRRGRPRKVKQDDDVS